MGSIPTLVRVFLCPCVGPFPSVGLTLTWFIWDRNIALHITLYSVNSIMKHDEFIKATFSSENFFETNNIFAIRGKNPFLFHYVCEENKINRVKLSYAILQQNKIQDQTVSMKNLFLE